MACTTQKRQPAQVAQVITKDPIGLIGAAGRRKSNNWDTTWSTGGIRDNAVRWAITAQYACPSPNGCPTAENVKPDMHDYGWTDAALRPSAAP